MAYTVYEILCTVDGRKYVGATVDFIGRKRVHLAYARNGYKLGNRLYDAMRLHGEEKFHFSVLESGLTKEQSHDSESRWIAQFDCLNPDKGFNVTSGGLDYRERSARAVARRQEIQAADPEAYRKTLSERAHAQHAKTTPEYRSELARKRDAEFSAEYLSARGKHASSKISVATHKAAAAKRVAAKTPEQMAETLAKLQAGRKARWAALTPEQKSAQAKLRWETRRRNQTNGSAMKAPD